MDSLTITTPDDWHLHVRDGAALTTVIPHSAAQFGRAIIMPNLKPPITTTVQALAYRERILQACPANTDFHPLMTLYLTDNTPAKEIARAKDSGIVHAVKYYPAGATTNSDSGVTKLAHTYPVLEAMQKTGMPLLVHGEVTDPDVDVYDREAVFIEKGLEPLVRDFPELKIVFEHITTKQAVDYILQGSASLAATVTAHHLLFNRNAMFKGGIRPHYYCLPVLKRDVHQQALLGAVTSGNNRFFLGTDSAPHSKNNKESACGCAGIYTSHAAMAFYATVFEQAGALDKLEGFASFYGADFYGLPRNTTSITLQKTPWHIPDDFDFADEQGNAQRLVPLMAGESLSWQLQQPA